LHPLVADVDAVFEQEVLDLTQRQWMADVHHHFEPADFGRGFEILEGRGENISSKEVEDYLAGHPAVAEAAVVAAPDERLGERACAYVLLRPGQTLTMDDVRTHFAGLQVARQKTPERLEIVPALPRTPSGKVKKYELPERLRAPGG